MRAAPQSFPAFVFGAEKTSGAISAGTAESINAIFPTSLTIRRAKRTSRTTFAWTTSAVSTSAGQTSTMSVTVTNSLDCLRVSVFSSARAQEGRSKWFAIKSGAFERTVACLTPQRRKVRSSLSRTEMPQSSVNAAVRSLRTIQWSTIKPLSLDRMLV